MTHIFLYTLSTVHKTASLADKGNSEYFQSSGGAHIKHTQMPKRGIELGTFCSRYLNRTCFYGDTSISIPPFKTFRL